MKMKLRTRVANFFGVKTKDYRNTLMKEAFLSLNKRDALSYFPELKAVYEVKDRAFDFYQRTLNEHDKSVETFKRNEDRAQFEGVKALNSLFNKKTVALSFDMDDKTYQQSIQGEELQILRNESEAHFEKKMVTSPKIEEAYLKNYAELSHAYFSNPANAVKTFKELESLERVEKAALKAFSFYIDKPNIDKAVKYYINESIKQIARGQAPISSYEIEQEAYNLRKSPLGRTDLKKVKTVRTLKMHDCFKGEKIRAKGAWPKSAQSIIGHADAILTIEKNIELTQMKAAFISYPKELALTRHPSLNAVYHKFNSALDFYSQKVSKSHAIYAAKQLIDGDFEKALNKEPLLAVTEYDPNEHIEYIERTKHLASQERQVEASFNFVESTQDEAKTIEKEVAEESGANNNVVHLSPKTINNEPTPQTVRHQSSKMREVNGNAIALEDIFKAFKDSGHNIQKSYENYIESDYIDENNIENLKDDISINEQQEPLKPEVVADNTSKKTVDLSALTSTAPKLELTKIFASDHRSKTIEKESRYVQYDIPAIENTLKHNLEAFTSSLLGEPIEKSADSMRFGTKNGSLVVKTQGDKRGAWYDHQTGIGGGVIQLIENEKGVEFRQALQMAAEYCGIEGQKGVSSRIDMSDLRNSSLEPEKLKKIEYARVLANKSKPIQGTLAEKYLREHRGVDTSLCSSDIRFLEEIKEPSTKKHYPAMLVVGKSMNGTVEGVQVTYLNQDGSKAKELSNPKRSYGQIKGSNIAIHEGGNIIAVAEGVETAMSVASANPNLTVFSALGSFTNFSAQDFNAKGQTIIMCADNDGREHEATAKSIKAFDELSRKGFNVFVAKPSQVGKDFNDILKEQGADAVRSLINQVEVHQLSKGQLYQSQSGGLAFEKKREKEVSQGF